MNYEVVELEEKIVCGFTCVTSNESADMGKKIGGLWQQLYADPSAIEGRANGKSIGLYCDYGIPSEKDYTVLVGFEVSSRQSKSSHTQKTIPAGRYAKFTLKGDVVSEVARTWQEIWSTPLERTFTGDFEEYQEDCNGKEGTVFVYIAIK